MASTLLPQIGFAVAFGVLMSAFVMSVLLIPGFTVLLGNAAWWPSRVRSAAPEDAAEQPTLVPAGG
jgi:putative drug exporter of the RND superfamily